MNRIKPADNEFSRGAIEMTFSILRARHPQLALLVRNILAGHVHNSQDRSTLYQVEFEREQLLSITHALDEELKVITSPGMKLMAKALLEDWQRLLLASRQNPET